MVTNYSAGFKLKSTYLNNAACVTVLPTAQEM